MSETELKFAKRAIAKIAQMGGADTRLVLDYLKLFSSKEHPLSLEQTFEILCEVDEFWKTYPAEIWQKAVQKLLANKVSGSLKTPLLNHDLLIDEMELLADFERDDEPHEPVRQTTKPEPPTQFIPPTAEQKAQAAQHLQAMKQVCSRQRKAYPND
ncbi:hypothetical protein [Wielerella bovis]|uniref:hypothetical protein n=1 Tax=Wielerella bovis TaxID=2917790 RepID=UPI0020195787|nr:hypothetical protein [Wielerella bovis]ULJ61036.1 hypothetical protein MIS44_04060 [Wielerella bovis]